LRLKAIPKLLKEVGMALLVKSSLAQSTVSAISYNIGSIANMKTVALALINRKKKYLDEYILLAKSYKSKETEKYIIPVSDLFINIIQHL